MSLTYSEAKDAMFGHFNDNWNASDIEATLGYDVKVLWQDKEPVDKPPSDKFWLRVSRQTVGQPQAAFSNSEDRPGVRVFETYGLIFVQIFGPKSKAGAAELMDQIAQNILSIFRKPIDNRCVVFRNSMIREVPEERDTFRKNVISEFSYFQVE